MLHQLQPNSFRSSCKCPVYDGLQARENTCEKKLKLFLRQFWFSLLFNHMVKCLPRSLNRTFAALADPTRRRILEDLAGGDRCVTDLARPYRMSLPGVSKHLRVLERAGLVRRKRDGRVHRLKLEAKPMREAQAWIEEYRKFWEESFDRLDDYLKQLQKKETK
jgi:DNA-binding transcriptional ArsR family regulator